MNGHVCYLQSDDTFFRSRVVIATSLAGVEARNPGYTLVDSTRVADIGKAGLHVETRLAHHRVLGTENDYSCRAEMVQALLTSKRERKAPGLVTLLLLPFVLAWFAIQFAFWTILQGVGIALVLLGRALDRGNR